MQKASLFTRGECLTRDSGLSAHFPALMSDEVFGSAPVLLIVQTVLSAFRDLHVETTSSPSKPAPEYIPDVSFDSEK